MTLAKQTHGLNFFDIDTDLHFVLDALQPDQFGRWRALLSDYGAWVGGALDDEAAYTDRQGRPKLVPYGADGALINHVQYNPLWQDAAREVYRRGIVGLNYVKEPASYLVTFAMGYLTSQADVSLHCPVTMTGAVAYIVNRFAPEPVRRVYLPELTRMDGQALSAGTWATELHGGSDIGATKTIARIQGDHITLTGLKWFTSNVDGGIAVATARPKGSGEGSAGLGLYLVPSVLPDGSSNPMRIRRLKDKLGTCGVATGEVELTETVAVEIAPPPEGFKLMMEALEFSRIHNAMSAVGLQRRAFIESLCFAVERRAFGSTIISYPMVQHELVRMRVDLDADLALAAEAAHAFDQAWKSDLKGDAFPERTWLRLTTALAKYRTAENANRTCRAAIELIGGNGYTYDYVTPRLLRDAQVLTVWEGPANIQALEVLRLLDPPHQGLELFRSKVKGIAERADAKLAPLAEALNVALSTCTHAVAFLNSNPTESQRYARRLMDFMAHLLAAALLVEEALREMEAGGTRKTFVARALIERHLVDASRIRIGVDEGWVFEQFNRFVEADIAALANP